MITSLQKYKTYSILFSILLVLGFSIANANTINITVLSFEFNPKNVSCTVGDTIQWVWQDGDHTTTSVTVPSGAAPWDHAMNSTSTTFKYRVTVAGSYNYKCTPHASMGMTGTFTATTSSGIRATIQTGKLAFSIYPLPVKDYAVLALTSSLSAKSQITIYNIAGQEVSKKEVEIVPGKNEYGLDMSQLQSGIYFIEMYTAGENAYTVKVIKQ